VLLDSPFEGGALPAAGIRILFGDKFEWTHEAGFRFSLDLSRFRQRIARIRNLKNQEKTRPADTARDPLRSIV